MKIKYKVANPVAARHGRFEKFLHDDEVGGSADVQAAKRFPKYFAGEAIVAQPKTFRVGESQGSAINFTPPNTASRRTASKKIGRAHV